MKKIKESAGLVIIQNNKILLGHPTNAPWLHTYSFPKGGIEKDETHLDAAIRETKEEIGINFDISAISTSNEFVINYTNKQGKLYKKVYYYIVYLDDNLLPDIIPDNLLQKEEIDWAGFLTIEEAKEKIFWRFKEILDLLVEDNDTISI
jgi:ADP-ribose pyrophosphatase YjhB (NUDIX family)